MSNLEQQLLEAKAKMYDLLEANSTINSQLKELGGALQEIINIIGLTGDENGQVTVQEVVDFIRKFGQFSHTVEGGTSEEMVDKND